MKKLVVFAPNLKMGGFQRSLTYLLNELDKSKIDITLILFDKDGQLIKKLPSEIKILYFENYYDYFIKKYSTNTILNIIKSIFKFDIKYLYKYIISNFKYKFCKNIHDEQKIWFAIKNLIKKIKIDADYCLSYSQGTSTYYLVDKVITKAKKFAMFNTDYQKANYSSGFDYTYFNKLDKVICVSEQCRKTLVEYFNDLDEKIMTIENVTSIKYVNDAANENCCISKSDKVIVSVGRLEIEIKGYDFIIEVANLLSKEGYDFKWYILGDGSGRRWLEEKIKEYALENKLILLGTVINPYPYIKNADFVVQASRFEGKGRVLIESNILKTPVISTDFDSAYSEIINGENGYIVSKNIDALYNAVKYLLDFPEECDRLRSNIVVRKDTGIENYHKLFEI